MNKVLQDAIVTTITKATETAGKAVDFLSAEIPDVIKQLIQWKIAENGFLVFLALAFLIAWVTKLASHFYKRAEEDEPFCVVVIGGWLLSVFCSIIVICGSLELIQLIVAPKVWLIEYAAHLVKGAK